MAEAVEVRFSSFAKEQMEEEKQAEEDSKEATSALLPAAE